METSPDGGEVPLPITDEGELIFQSDAIVEYIHEVVGEPLLKGRALARISHRLN